MDKSILMKYVIAEFNKEFVNPFQFIFVPDSLKDQGVLNLSLRENLIAVLCNNERN